MSNPTSPEAVMAPFAEATCTTTPKSLEAANTNIQPITNLALLRDDQTQKPCDLPPSPWDASMWIG